MASLIAAVIITVVTTLVGDLTSLFSRVCSKL
jgi:Flp pilus assembly pilin Flp